MQELSVLDYEHPGDPTVTIDYAGRLAAMMTARNPAVDVSMTATWTRPDQTYRPEGHWYGKPATQMALDLRRGYDRSEEHTSELQSLMRISYAVFCLKKKTNQHKNNVTEIQ